MLRVFELGTQLLEGLGILVIPINVPSQADQLSESSRIDAAVLFDRVLDAGVELLEIPTCLGDANDRNIQVPPLDHGLQAGKDFFVSEVACRTKEDQRIRTNVIHTSLRVPALYSCGFFAVSSKSIAHGGQQFVGIVGFATRAETLVKRSRQNRYGDGLINRRLDGPAPFAGIGHSPGELLEFWIVGQRA